MKFAPTRIAGVFLIDIEPRIDDRGSFARIFCHKEFEAKGISLNVVQCNLAHTNQSGLVRGLHYQEAPAADAKLVRCLLGAVFDVLVDMRPESPTYRAKEWVRLDAVQRQALFVPGGVAHGYQALEDHTEFMYMTDQYYQPGLEKGVRYNDPMLAIPWPLTPLVLAERDQQWPLLD